MLSPLRLITFYSSLLLTTHAFTPHRPIAVAPSSPSATSALFASTAAANKKSMFSIPSLFNPVDSRPIVLFDGKCNLCNAAVQLILDRDSKSNDSRGNLRVAALQSRIGSVLLSRLSSKQRESVLGDGEYKSIVVAEKDTTHLNSDACIYIGKNLSGPLRYLALLARIVPRFIRDFMYKLLSRYRKKLFGESPECRLWDDNWDTRFVNDGLFGGRDEEDDMFADPSLAVQEDENVVEEPMLTEGETVRVVSDQPVLHTHVSGYEGGLCSVGLVGKVMRVLNPRAYPKSVAVKFDLEGKEFEAHFRPGELRKE